MGVYNDLGGSITLESNQTTYVQCRRLNIIVYSFYYDRDTTFRMIMISKSLSDGTTRQYTLNSTTLFSISHSSGGIMLQNNNTEECSIHLISIK